MSGRAPIWRPPSGSASAALAAAAVADQRSGSRSNVPSMSGFSSVSAPGLRINEATSLLAEMKLKQEKRTLRDKLKKDLELLQASPTANTGTTFLRIIELKAQLSGVEAFLNQVDGTQINNDPVRPPPSDFCPDSESTNLYVGSLAAEWTEELIMREFGKYGDVTSIKIMYPRTEMQRVRGMNCGFVQFRTRKQAETAKAKLNGKECFGMALRIDWGKSVSMSSTTDTRPNRSQPHVPHHHHHQHQLQPYMEPAPPPAYPAIAAPPSSGAPPPPPPTSSSSSPPSTRNHGFDPIPPPPGGGPPATGGASQALVVAQPDRQSRWNKVKTIVVQIPEDSKQKRLIDKCAEFVAIEGWDFESLLYNRERGNPRFEFLKRWKAEDMEDPLTVYYRWRVFSFAQGDSEDQWRTEPFQIYDNGPLWQPPQCEQRERAEEITPTFTIPHFDTSRGLQLSGATRRRNSGGVGSAELTTEEKQQLDNYINGLSLTRPSIAEAMAFCLDNSPASIQISQCISQSIVEVQPGLTTAQLYSRVCLLSDVLFNSHCTKPGASMYRRQFQESLPEVFEKLGEVCDGLSALAASALKERLFSMLKAWSEWSTFPPQFTKGLEVTLCCRGPDRPALEPSPEAAALEASKPILLQRLQQWRLCTDQSALARACRLRGLSTSGGNSSNNNNSNNSSSNNNSSSSNNANSATVPELVARLLAFEAYWFEKDPPPVIPIVVPRAEDEDVFDPELDGEALTESDLRAISELEQEAQQATSTPSVAAKQLLKLGKTEVPSGETSCVIEMKGASAAAVAATSAPEKVKKSAQAEASKAILAGSTTAASSSTAPAPGAGRRADSSASSSSSSANNTQDKSKEHSGKKMEKSSSGTNVGASARTGFSDSRDSDAPRDKKQKETTNKKDSAKDKNKERDRDMERDTKGSAKDKEKAKEDKDKKDKKDSGKAATKETAKANDKDKNKENKDKGKDSSKDNNNNNKKEDTTSSRKTSSTRDRRNRSSSSSARSESSNSDSELRARSKNSSNNKSKDKEAESKKDKDQDKEKAAAQRRAAAQAAATAAAAAGKSKGSKTASKDRSPPSRSRRRSGSSDSSSSSSSPDRAAAAAAREKKKNNKDNKSNNNTTNDSRSSAKKKQKRSSSSSSSRRGGGGERRPARGGKSSGKDRSESSSSDRGRSSKAKRRSRSRSRAKKSR